MTDIGTELPVAAAAGTSQRNVTSQPPPWSGSALSVTRNLSADWPAWLEPRDCPICDGNNRLMLHSQRFAEMSAGSLMAGYDVVVCEACGLVYADNIPSQAAFDAHYRDMSKYERQEYGCRESEFDLRRFRAMAQIVDRVRPDRATRILDVGCAMGGMLAALKDLGYSNLLGVDPSPSCAAAAAELHGMEVLTGTFSDLPVGDRKFDLIVLSNILEHVRDLKPALRRLCEVLDDNGMIYVQVPDASRFANRDDAPFQEFSTEHINFFSAVSLANLMRALGFRAVFSENTAYDQDQGARLPIVDAVFQRRSSAALPLIRDDITEPDLQLYVRDSRKVDERIRQTIDEILVRDEEIVVWGVGTHTLRLLSTSRLKDAKIVAFVDSNPRYQGKTLQGAPIIAPTALRPLSAGGRVGPQPILVSSRVFQRNIEDQIRNALKLENRLYLLYDLQESEKGSGGGNASSTKLISVMTPCYNEEDNVEECYRQVKAMFDKLGKYRYEHVFIDNASNDGTRAILRKLAAADKNVKLIFNARNFGHIRSPYYGLLQCRGDAVIPVVADLQDPIALIPQFLEKWEEGSRIVMGVKVRSKESPGMFVLRKVYYKLVRGLSEIELTGNFYGFGVYDRKVMEVLRKIDEPYPYFRGLVADIGFPPAKIEYVQPRRERGITKNNFYSLYDLAMLGITNHSKLPLRVATFSGFCLAAVSLLVAMIYGVYKLLFWYQFQVGIAPLVIGIFFFGAVQLFFTGILGEYIGAIYTQVQKRPLVIESERINW